MKEKIVEILERHIDEALDYNNVADELCVLFGVSKRYYWLKADGTISNMWNEEDHKKYISEQDIKDAEKDGWQLIQINVC